MRDKPDAGFDCFDAGSDAEEDDSDGLLDVLLADVVGYARTGVERRWFGGGSGVTPDNDSLRDEPPNCKQNSYVC